MTTTETPQNLPGDVNCNRVVNMIDVVYLQKYLMNQHYLNAESKKAADMNSDGRVNVFDMMLLKKAVIG